jgi:hypothetical protein
VFIVTKNSIEVFFLFDELGNLWLKSPSLEKLRLHFLASRVTARSENLYPGIFQGAEAESEIGFGAGLTRV